MSDLNTQLNSISYGRWGIIPTGDGPIDVYRCDSESEGFIIDMPTGEFRLNRKHTIHFLRKLGAKDYD